MKPQPEETLEQSSLSQYETPEGNQQEAEDQAEKTKEEEGTETETPSGETHESLAHIEVGLDSNVKPKEDSLVEISFDDVPEAQQITEVGEKQPEEEGSVEVLETKILEMQQEEESKEVTAVETDQNISGTQHHNEPEMEGAEKEFKSEVEEMESQHKASDIRKEKVDTNDFNLHDSDDDETGEGVRTISSSHQPTTEADKENLEDETDHMNEDSEKIREGEFCQNEDSVEETTSNDPDFKEDETTDTVGGDKGDVQTEDYSEMEDEDINDGGAENHPSLVTQSNTSVAAMEAESETLGASAQHLPEESQRALVESHPEDTVEEKGVTLKEAREVVEEGKMDSEVQEKSDAMCEESISLTHIADGTAADHQGEERPLGSEKDTTEPEGKSSNKGK
ncbi:enolase-phosphatase E1-like protein [Lates japonicus]|uniref:Enolase-phosphatase E1-like protein n=1 Tax=Lates japonicus TaxID=270547 RepID=A0AAD3MFJ2_LATJO|nr:enolase-phosphatase E1-like protein [Lates japonicus]